MIIQRIRGIVEWLLTRLSRFRWGTSPLESLTGNGTPQRKAVLIERILDIEWQMFSYIRSLEASKNDHGEKLYRAIRRKIHSVLPDDVIESYLQDLQRAEREGRNLIQEKFDRREGKLPPLKENAVIPRIVELEIAWKMAMDRNSPHVKLARNEEAFRLYITSELETYSDGTLDLYYRAVLEARRVRRNLVEERYRNHASAASLGGNVRKQAKPSSRQVA